MFDAGISKVSIGLHSDNPQQYSEIVRPLYPISFSLFSNDGDKTSSPVPGFGDVCSMVIACAEAGLVVTCTAVDRPRVKASNIRSLAHSLGATDFQLATYFP